MKKTLLAASVSIVALMVVSCQQQQPPTSQDCPPGCKDYSGRKMKGIIDAKVAYDIANSYASDKSKATIEGTGEADATSIWFSLDELKQYIWKMETELAKKKYNADSLDLGIRIYYAKYPDADAMKKLGFKPEYALHHTAFIVATYKGKNKNIDFDPWNIGNGDGRPVPLRDLLQRSGRIGRQAAAGVGADDGDPGVLNQGGLIPPPAGDGFGFPQSDN